jgi:hypothetical protein
MANRRPAPLVALATAAAAALLLLLPAPAAGWGGVYNVRDYGAVGDGATLDTRALRVLLALVGAAGGGEVLFPAPYRFLTAPLNFSSNTLLRVEGALAFAARPDAGGVDDWPVIPNFPWYGPPGDVQFQPCLMGWGVSNVTVTGGGVIDGNGSAWWGCATAPAAPPCGGVQRPAALFYPHNGTGVTVSNVTFRDSPFWHLRPSFVDGVLVRNVTITAAPAGAAHNTGECARACARSRARARVEGIVRRAPCAHTPVCQRALTTRTRSCVAAPTHRPPRRRHRPRLLPARARGGRRHCRGRR